MSYFTRKSEKLYTIICSGVGKSGSDATHDNTVVVVGEQEEYRKATLFLSCQTVADNGPF